MKVLSLFSGIGAPEQALKNIGKEFELVGFSEIDKYAIKSYCAIHEVDESLNLGDITKIDIQSLPRDIDLITHGSPCQDFSIAGNSKGGDEGSGTRSSLMWNAVEIIKHCKPKYVIWENVKNVLSEKHIHNFNNYLNELEKVGYNNYYKVLNSKDFGVAQSRERIFVVSIKNSKPFSFHGKQRPLKRITDILEEQVDNKYYMDKKMIKKASTENDIKVIGMLEMKAQEIIRRVYDPNGLCPTLNTMQGGHRQPKILIDGKVRKLTPRECWRLMGFKDTEFDKASAICSNSQLYKQAGNSIVVPVLEEIFKNLFL